MPQLVFFKDNKPLIQRPFDQASLIIGRDPASDIQLFEPQISRKHCTIEKQNGHFVLKDFSRNGTLVNNKPAGEIKVVPTDDIQIGPWLVKLALDHPTTNMETVIAEKNKISREQGLGPMLGNSKTMKGIFQLIGKAAPSDIPVCLIGESGTGKELAAKLIHDLSPRQSKPFVAINCGAIPSNLIESLLFGHEKGSFTGASERHQGVFEQAHEGTLFLDEIGEMPLDLQTRLLRVMESQTLRRVGGKADLQINVRLVTATLRDLRKEVEQEKFRQDLFYRLYIFPIALPPLRERSEDIALLAKHFLKIFAPAGQKRSLSAPAMKKLQQHKWPGNVRELKNTIQRTLLLSRKETIEAKELELTHVQNLESRPGEAKLGDQERISIVETLRKTKGNHAKAARLLGIARTTLASKLRRYKLDESEWL